MGFCFRPSDSSSRFHYRIGALAVLSVVMAATRAFATTNPRKIPPPLIQHVFIIMEENRAYSQVVGNPDRPFFNSLIPQGAIANNYFAFGHPSIDDYFMLTTGKAITFNDDYAKVVHAYNLARELMQLNADWKAYVENLPTPDPTAAGTFPYEKHHDPFAYFSDFV